MVKIQDGSLVPASELISGAAQDDEGKPLKFELVKDAAMPQFKAESKMDDGSGRTRIYSFGFDDTNVVVHMMTIEEEKDKDDIKAEAKEAKAERAGIKAEAKEAKTEKVTKEVTPSLFGSAADTKKKSF